MPLPIPWRSLVATAFAVGSFVGCSWSHLWEQNQYDTCRSRPEENGDGEIRSGFVSKMRRSLVERPEMKPSFHVSIARRNCLDTVTVKGAGTSHTAGPYLPIWVESFEVSYAANRLAFVAYKNEEEGFVWIDGKAEGPYRQIVRSPAFSENGRHVAYVVKGANDEELLVVDGRVARKFGRAKPRDRFKVLDDGRVMAQLTSPDGTVAIAIGDTTTDPLLQICSLDVGPNGHWGYTANTRKGWIVVVDGRASRNQGRHACQVVFSENGEHFAYRTSAAAGGGESGVIVDDHYEPLEVGSGTLRFVGDLAVVTFLLRGDEILHVAARPPPRVPPTSDDYQPHQSAPAQRVRMGQSAGPLFDRIEIESLRIDEQGRLHYRASREGRTIDVVDNQIQQ